MLVNQLLRSTEDLLSCGGDDRQTVIEDGEKLNKYFSSASLRPEVIRRGSCTCSTVDLKGYLEAEKVKIKLLTDLLTRNDGKQHMEVFDLANLGIISRLESLFNFHSSSGVNDNHGIVLFPSGSDAEYLPLTVGLIRSYNNSVQHKKINSSTTSESTESRSEVVHNINNIKVYNNVIAAGEVGSGTSYACSGQHFSTVTPKGMSALPEASATAHNKPNTHIIGEVLEGVQPHWVETVEFKPRNSDGGVDFQETAIQNALQQQMTTSDTSVSILHVVLGSKTGLVYPSLNVVKKLTEAYGERLVVVVDACQLRCDLSVLKEFVDEGYIVLFTGSKFFTGPPFCGGVLVPGRIVSEIESHLQQQTQDSVGNSYDGAGLCMVAAGLREYLTSYQVSAHMTEFRRFLAADDSASNSCNDNTDRHPERAHSSYFNIGLYLRWSIALPLMEAYHSPALTTQLKVSYTDSWTHQIKSLVAKYCDFLCLVDSGNNKANNTKSNIYNRSNVDGIISIAVRVPIHNNNISDNNDNNSYSRYLSIEEKNSRSLSAGGNQSRYMSAEEKENSSRYLSMDELKEYHKILTQSVKCGDILTDFINNNENKYKNSITTLNNKIMIGQPVKLCDAKKNTTGTGHVTNSNHSAATPTGVVRIALGVDMVLSYAEQKQLEVTAQDIITVEKMYLVAKYWNFIGDTKNKAQNIESIISNSSNNGEKKRNDKLDDNHSNHSIIDTNNTTVNNNNKFHINNKQNNTNKSNDTGSTDISINAYSAELAHKLTTIDHQLNVATISSNAGCNNNINSINNNSLSQAETVASMLQSAFGNDNSGTNNSNNSNNSRNINSNNNSNISSYGNSSVSTTNSEVNSTATALTNSTAMPLVGLYYNLDTITATITSLHSAFTTTLNSQNYAFYHCFAIKACPIIFILHYIVHTMHCGLECASICEIKQALKVKCPVEVIVFDSPCKTSDEIMFVLSHNITMNINSYAELAKVKECLGQLESQGVVSSSIIGLRVNPMVGAGSNASLSTATATSKFGIPLYSKEVDCGQVATEGLVSDFSAKIVQTYKENTFLTGIMCHVGSQGMPLHLMAEGAKRILSLADTIDSACHTSNNSEVSQLAPRIKYVDIGGGLSANYSSDSVTPTFEEYASALAVACPALCSNSIQTAHKRTVITEFGKAIIAKSGTIVTAIEDVLIHSEEENYNPVESAEAVTTISTTHLPVVSAICHAGADLLLRTAYCYDKFPHRVALLDSNYQMLCDAEEINNSIFVKKNSSTIDNNTNHSTDSNNGNNNSNNSISTRTRSKCTLTIAGPLCFSGDNIVQRITFPLPEVKDVVLVLDAGANTISMFSKHCSRQSPPVFVFRKAVNETVDDNSNNSTIGSVLNSNNKPNNKNYTVVCVRERETEDSVLQFWD